MYMYSPMRLARQYWWMMLVWGVAIAIFGLCALLWPHLTLLTLIVLFGVFAVVNGVLGIVTAFQARRVLSSWWMTLCAGMVSLLIGLAVLFWPHASAIVILYLIASWAIIIGVLQLSEAIGGLGRYSPLFLAISGLAALILGIVLFASSPLVALLTLVWLIGLYALIAGVMFILRAFYFRSLLRREDLQEQRRHEPEFLP
jgi:uncharacterized membrane protein HdeD (DUF308 family)